MQKEAEDARGSFARATASPAAQLNRLAKRMNVAKKAGAQRSADILSALTASARAPELQHLFRFGVQQAASHPVRGPQSGQVEADRVRGCDDEAPSRTRMISHLDPEPHAAPTYVRSCRSQQGRRVQGR